MIVYGLVRAYCVSLLWAKWKAESLLKTFGELRESSPKVKVFFCFFCGTENEKFSRIHGAFANKTKLNVDGHY